MFGVDTASVLTYARRSSPPDLVVKAGLEAVLEAELWSWLTSTSRATEAFTGRAAREKKRAQNHTNIIVDLSAFESRNSLAGVVNV